MFVFYSLEDVRVHVRLVRLLVEPPHLLDLLPRPRRQDADERLLEAKVLFVLVDDVLQTLGIEPSNENCSHSHMILQTAEKMDVSPGKNCFVCLNCTMIQVRGTTELSHLVASDTSPSMVSPNIPPSCSFMSRSRSFLIVVTR